MTGERLDNRVKFSTKHDADIANRESLNNRRRRGKGERMPLIADSMIRELGFKNSILKPERCKLEERSPLERVGWGALRNYHMSFILGMGKHFDRF
jgi:hypothetical protein